MRKNGLLIVRKKGCGRSKEGGRGKVAWKDWWERNRREDYATALNISQSKKTSEKRGKNSSKESRSQEYKVQGREGGGAEPTCTTRTSPLMQKKKKRPHNRFCITAFIETKEYRKQRGRGGGGGGRRFKRCMGSERNWGIYATCSVSPSSKRDALQSCK